MLGFSFVCLEGRWKEVPYGFRGECVWGYWWVPPPQTRKLPGGVVLSRAVYGVSKCCVSQVLPYCCNQLVVPEIMHVIKEVVNG
jgi:hypothetical protein